MFENFYGNQHAVRALQRLIAQRRIPQTLLFSGPEGVGKATLARRFAAALLNHPELIEQDDLSLPANLDLIQAREKWPAEKRNDDPLVFSSHPDFMTFAPDGPLRQLIIPQMRLLKERAAFKPSRGARRIFLIDHVDRAGDNVTNSLLKILEEPPEHLILIMTSENAYDLLPTIRSRSVMLSLSPLPVEAMREFAAMRRFDSVDRRIALSAGSPGHSVSLDLAVYDKRRAAMHALLKVAAGAAPFGLWIPYSDSISRSKNEKLELYLRLLYELLRDVMLLRENSTEIRAEIRNQDLRAELAALAQKVSTRWIIQAVKKTDELATLIRRNIQKTIALDDLILDLRSSPSIRS